MIDGFEYFKKDICLHLAGRIASEQMAIPANPLEKTAFHEAAHATIGLYFGMRPTRAEIKLGAGGCVFFGGVDSRPLSEVLASIESDAEKIKQSSEVLSVCGQQPDLPALEREVAGILAEKWESVCGIARALLDSGELMGPELEELYGKRWWRECVAEG